MAMKLEPEAKQRVTYDEGLVQRFEGILIRITGRVHAVLCSATQDDLL